MFLHLFERSADAIWLFDPQAGVFVDCNQAAVELMRARGRDQLLQQRPEDLSPPAQPDGTSTPQRLADVTSLPQQTGGYRFEWMARRLDGELVPLEVLATPITVDDRNLHVIVSRDITARKRTEVALRESEQKFRTLFEASCDGILILDPENRRYVDCNAAVLKKTAGKDKEWLQAQALETLWPECQPDGRSSRDAANVWIERALTHGPQRFEWVARLPEGNDIPVEMLLTPVHLGGRRMLVAVTRDISERKKHERELMELNQSLEQRVAERTAALTTSEARCRALVEHAPEAIVVFDGDTGRIQFGNKHASALYGVPMEKLAELTPGDVSPEFQPGGRKSSELARARMDEALGGGNPVFEWIHRRPDGQLVPAEVRLLRLPAEGRNLIRASIIDNTERQRAERALRESEEKFRALFEESSQGVILHDETKFLEVNPAAVQIMGCRSAEELLGKYPTQTSPHLQPNGESSAIMARQHIDKCLRDGSTRFEWTSYTPQGVEISLEVTLTRIQWSGRQVIQALLNNISERKQAEQALHAANRVLHQEIQQRTRAEESLKARIQLSLLNAEVAVALNANTGLRAMLEECAALVVQYLEVPLARLWTLNQGTQWLELEASAGVDTPADSPPNRLKVGQSKIGLIAGERKPHLTNNLQADPKLGDLEWARSEGLVAFAGYPLLLENRVLGVLAIYSRRPLTSEALTSLGSVADSLALGIERKRAQAALAESEARFSAAFQACPIFISIMRMADERYVLANEAFASWLGVAQEEILGRNSAELDIWEDGADRELARREFYGAGCIRQREARWRNRAGVGFTILYSAETIMVDNTPHILCLAQDITQRKHAEAELLRTLAREKELSKLKSNFVSLVSHEFRTPLSIIQSSAELLREFYPRMPVDDRQEHLDSISRNSRRMAGMMEAILVFSRLDAGKLEFQPARLDLQGFCHRVVAEVRSATNCRCEIDLELNSVPPAAMADERLLGHIFTNLLGNAVKYSEPGTKVQFSIACVGSEAICVIRDQGIGIAEEDQEHLFKAFHRGGNVGTRPGTGLGLLLVKRCADLHGGTVRLQSRIQEGTTVTVSLPLFKTNHEKDIDHRR